MKSRPFEFADQVTESQAAKFTALLFEKLSGSGALGEAVGESGIIEWPETPDDFDESRELNTPEQVLYLDVESRICDRLELVARPALERAFREAATEVLSNLQQQ